MAISYSYGYPGTFTMDPTKFAQWGFGAGQRYWVYNPDQIVAAPVLAGTRQVSISSGFLGAWNVVDYNDGAVVLTLDTVVSGTRWFLICARRNWSTKVTTFVAIDVGTTPIVPGSPTRNVWNPNDTLSIEDQPLWLVPLTSGQTVPGTPIDVRALGTGKGFQEIRSDLALAYLGYLGAQVKLGSVQYERVLNSGGTGHEWRRSGTTVGSTLTRVFPFGTGAAGKWSCVNQAADNGSFAVLDGNDREIVWRIRNLSDTVIFNAGGNPIQGDVIIANAGNVPYRPDEDRKGFSGKCWTTNGSTYGVWLDYLANGDLVLISGPPSQTLRQSSSLYAIEASMTFKKRGQA